MKKYNININRKNEIAVGIVLLLSWCIFICMFSSKPADASKQQSDIFTNMFSGMFSLIFKDFDETTFELCAHFMRKLAHFSLFAVLGFFAFNTFSDSVYKNKVIICVIFCVLYAVSDEIHQIFSSGRACQFSDILLDTTGSLTGMLIYCPIYLKKKGLFY